MNVDFFHTCTLYILFITACPEPAFNPFKVMNASFNIETFGIKRIPKMHDHVLALDTEHRNKQNK